MPTKAYSFTTTEVKLDGEPTRTAITFQNVDTVGNIYVSDNEGMALSEGIIIRPGGTFSVKRSDGCEPEKAFYVVSDVAGGVDCRLYVEYADYPIVLSYDVTNNVPESLSPWTPSPNNPTGGSGNTGPLPSASDGNGTPTDGTVQSSSTCMMSAIMPFNPLLNKFRHLRDLSSFPQRLKQLYYQIPYPKRPILLTVKHWLVNR